MSHRGYPITRTMRANRRQAAEARQAEYDKLTDQQKLVRLGDEPAVRQRLRIVSKWAAAETEAKKKAEAKAKIQAETGKSAPVKAKKPQAPGRRRGFYMGMRDE